MTGQKHETPAVADGEGFDRSSYGGDKTHGSRKVAKTDAETFVASLFAWSPGWTQIQALKRAVASFRPASDPVPDVTGKRDLYVNACPQREERGTGSQGRTADGDAGFLATLWADLDRAGEPGHKGTGKLWAVDDIRRLSEWLPVKPTVAVDSGGGWHLWFRLDVPLEFGTDGLAEVTLARWGRWWRETVATEFDRQVDAVFNPGRIMRIPGTVNTKEGVERPARILKAYPERSVSLDDLDFLPSPTPDRRTTSPKVDDERPGDRYNRDATVDAMIALLEGEGFHGAQRKGGRVDLTRSGKNRRDGHSVTVWSDATVTFWSSAPDGLPGAVELRDRKHEASGTYDPFGLYAALKHRGDTSEAARELARENGPPPTHVVTSSKADAGEPPDHEPIDLRELMSGEPPDEEWCAEPVLPARKLTGFVAARGEGKSLFALDIAARKAAGVEVLGQHAGPPIHVVYLDQEMGPDDLFERLADLGWTPDHPKFGTLVEHLHYYQLVTIPPLDTEEGGIEFEKIIERHAAELAVIDTVSRVISGDENASEPFLALFRNTEMRLKRRGVTVARLDHLGKDHKKGSRGASAKEDALDVVWQLKETGLGSLTLTRTKGRAVWIPATVHIDRRTTNGILEHTIPDEPAPEWLVGLVRTIDRLGLADDAGVNVIQKTLQASGDGRRRSQIAQAVKFRKGRAKGGNHPGTTLREPPPEPPGTTPQETQQTQGKNAGNHPGNRPELVVVPKSIPMDGNHLTGDSEEAS